MSSFSVTINNFCIVQNDIVCTIFVFPIFHAAFIWIMWIFLKVEITGISQLKSFTVPHGMICFIKEIFIIISICFCLLIFLEIPKRDNRIPNGFVFIFVHLKPFPTNYWSNQSSDGKIKIFTDLLCWVFWKGQTWIEPIGP